MVRRFYAREVGGIRDWGLVTRDQVILSRFHPARTLSGSLCSPPSPRGEGYNAEKRYSRMSRFCMTAEQPLEEGARRRRRIDLPRRGSLLREGMKGDVSGAWVLS